MDVGHTSGQEVSLTVSEEVLQQVRSLIPPGTDTELTLASSLYDIGIDSLARMGVVNRLEEVFGIRLPEESLHDLETCGDLVVCIQTSLSPGQPQSRTCEVPVSAGAELAAGPEASDVALFPECLALQQRLTDAATAGFQIPFFRIKQQVDAATALVNGQQVISYTSFDYLGMSQTPCVKEAARQAIEQFGTSASASRLVGGDSTILAELDSEIADFLGTEAAIVFPSGYGTNASVLEHLFHHEDLILYDELAHNSIMHGATTSKAQRRPFPHNDYEFLDRLLVDVRGKHRRVVIALDGVYSMDGDYPDLVKFLEVKRKHRALLYVDEAHSFGVLGGTGRGISEHFGVDPNEGDIWMGTISKALGSAGGFIAGRAMLIQYLKYTTPAFVFATAVSPPNSAAALAALRCLREQPERVTRLRQRAALFLKVAKACGLNTGDSHDTPVIPIIVGNSMRCIWISHELLRQGIDAQPILYPAVPERASRIRFFITANHTDDQILRTVSALTECLAASESIT